MFNINVCKFRIKDNQSEIIQSVCMLYIAKKILQLEEY